MVERYNPEGSLNHVVKWRGWDDMTCEPAGNLGGCEDLIREFEDSQVSYYGHNSDLSDIRLYTNSFKVHMWGMGREES